MEVGAKNETVPTPERPGTSKVTLQLADPKDYIYAASKDTAGKLENAEYDFLQAAVKIAKVYDQQTPFLLGETSKREAYSMRLQDEFEKEVRQLNPKGIQIAEKSGMAEIIEQRDPLSYEWEYGNVEDYRYVQSRHGHAGFLALHLIENTVLVDLHNNWMNLERAKMDIGLSGGLEATVTRSPYLSAEIILKEKLIKLQSEMLDLITEQNRPLTEIDNLTDAASARQKALEKLKDDLPFSIVKEKYDAGVLEPVVFREIHTFTKDPKTGIRFITYQGFQKRGKRQEFELWGNLGINAFGPDKKIYSLTPQYHGPAYSSKTGNQSLDSFSPYYYDERGNTRHLTPEQQLDIWNAYCRAGCDKEETKKDYKKEMEGRYTLEEMYWGSQMVEVERYKDLKENLKLTKLMQDAVSSDFGKVRLGICMRERNVKEEIGLPTEEELRQIQEAFDKHWENPDLSELSYQKDKSWGYIEFGYPYGQGGGSYPNDYGKVLDIRFTQKEKKEILIRDAFDRDTGIGATGYLKLEWGENGKWKIERGRYTRTTDAYFLNPDEKKASLTKKDAQTILTLMNLLSTPKQKRK